MNVQAAIARPVPIKLRVHDFLLLKEAGAFAAFTKSELLQGELWGVPRGREEEPDYDSSFPIQLRIADYELLERSGAFEGYRKTELIDGVVYAMNPQYRPHMFAKDELAYRLRRSLEAAGSNLHVGIEGSVALSDVDLPLPDILLTDEPKGAGPVPGRSIRMLVEISTTSLDYDLSHKARIYAARSVPEYWVVDVNAGVIHQMWSPGGGAYAERREVKLGERIEAATIAGLAVETAGIS
ncbi:MAG TPA: Uma2 family endonuclease [Allosphingosinicella sp.]|nr:Uma2 family endonuclease [Allosphingosinicella sp.]